MQHRQRFNECYDDVCYDKMRTGLATTLCSREHGPHRMEAVLAALTLVFVRAAQESLQRALLASAAPLFEARRGGALDLFRRPRLPRTEVANAAGKQHGKRLGERHGIGLVTRLRHALGAAQIHHQPDRTLAEQTARPGVVKEGTLPGLG